MVRQPCCDKLQVKKGPWTSEEDRKLVDFMLANGRCCWRTLPMLAGLRRCGKSCRLRWTNYLRPDLKRGLLTQEEEQLIIDLHAEMGNRWSKIAARMPGRTDNDIKNRWNTYIKKRLVTMGIDPVTHKPLTQEQFANTSDHHSSSTASPQPASSVSTQVTTCSVQNSSGKNFQLLPNIFDDENTEFPLLNHLWSDEISTTQLVDAGSLGFPCEDEELSDIVGENKEFTWLMDYAENGFMDSFELRCHKENNENKQQ